LVGLFISNYSKAVTILLEFLDEAEDRKTTKAPEACEQSMIQSKPKIQMLLLRFSPQLLQS
jgi:hypothetical protein